MDERQRPIPTESLQTRLVRFATVILCASLCSAVVGAVGVKPNAPARPKAPSPVFSARPFEPVEMVPVRLSPRTGTKLLEPVSSLPATPAPADLLHPFTTTSTAASELLVTPPTPPLKSILPPAITKRHRVIRMEVTAYCHCIKCCGPLAQGVTASGKPVTYNQGFFVAADTSVLPFGTKLIIPGYAENLPVEVIDRGGAIKGYRLDVYYPNHDVAREWGRRFVNVIVLE
jgi:3D (Asp-Asp-Asp) domain-containing protein